MKTKRTIEIRAGEGGEDARLFTAELALAYLRMADRKAWKVLAHPSPDTRTGAQLIVLEIEGDGADRLDAEGGGHRVQRVPRTERSGRVHSSTVTVAVIEKGSDVSGSAVYLARGAADFRCDYYSGTIGAGGQNHQKTQNCVRLTHILTGTVRTAQTRSRKNSLQNAMAAMNAELDRLAKSAGHAAENGKRRDQVGSGERSDRRRTWAFQRDLVEDFRTGRSVRCTEAMKGHLDRLW